MCLSVDSIYFLSCSSPNVLDMREPFSNITSYGSCDERRPLLRNEDSFDADDQVSRWHNDNLNPVPQDQKTWEWYHVGGFWIVNGFTAANIQTASANVALGLNPGLIMIAYLIGIMIVAVACTGSGYIGAKVSNVIETMRASTPSGAIGCRELDCMMS